MSNRDDSKEREEYYNELRLEELRLEHERLTDELSQLKDACEENPVNRFVNQLLEENYNLKLSIDNFKEIFDRKDRVHNRLNQDYLALKNKANKLETKVKRKYYSGMPKEVKQELKEILKSLETSCKFDESMKYDQFNMEEPERARYEDLKMCRDKLRRILV